MDTLTINSRKYIGTIDIAYYSENIEYVCYNKKGYILSIILIA